MPYYVDRRNNPLYRGQEELRKRQKEYEKAEIQRRYEESKARAREQERNLEIAKRIDEQLQKEGKKNMKKVNFKKVFENLAQVYKEAYEINAEIQSNNDIAEDEFIKQLNNARNNPEQAEVIKAYRTITRNSYKKKYDNLLQDINERVNHLRELLEEGVKVYYAKEPSAIDHDTIKLLELGIFNENDLERIVEENKNNVTMLSVIQKYTDKSKDINIRVLNNTIKGMLDNEKELNTFDSLVEFSERALSVDASKRKTFDIMNEQAFNNVIDSALDYDIPVAE